MGCIEKPRYVCLGLDNSAIIGTVELVDLEGNFLRLTRNALINHLENDRIDVPNLRLIRKRGRLKLEYLTVRDYALFDSVSVNSCLSGIDVLNPAFWEILDDVKLSSSAVTIPKYVLGFDKSVLVWYLGVVDRVLSILEEVMNVKALELGLGDTDYALRVLFLSNSHKSLMDNMWSTKDPERFLALGSRRLLSKESINLSNKVHLNF